MPHPNRRPTTDSPPPVVGCRACDGTGISPANPNLICGTCDGTREDPASPVWQTDGPPDGMHWPQGTARCWLVLRRAVCVCGWRTWPRRTADKAGAVLYRHMILAGRADVRAAGRLWTPGS